MLKYTFFFLLLTILSFWNPAALLLAQDTFTSRDGHTYKLGREGCPVESPGVKVFEFTFDYYGPEELCLQECVWLAFLNMAPGYFTYTYIPPWGRKAGICECCGIKQLNK